MITFQPTPYFVENLRSINSALTFSPKYLNKKVKSKLYENRKKVDENGIGEYEILLKLDQVNFPKLGICLDWETNV